MDAKLGGAIRREEGFFWWCIDFDRNGWKQPTQSGELRLSQKVLCLKVKRIQGENP